MNSYERVMNALQGRPVDRPPVLAVLGAYGGRLTGVPLPELYCDANQYVEGQRAVIDTFGIDMALAPFDFSALAEAFGGSIRFFDHQPPNMRKPAAANISQALTLPLPDPHTTGRLPMILEATHELAQRYHGTVPVFAVLPGPAVLPTLMLGMELWLDTALFDEAAARQIMHRTAPFWTQWASALLDAGADALIITEGMAAATISTRELFEHTFLPHVRDCFGQLSAPLVFHHTGGPITHVADLLADLPNLAGISISSQDHPHDVRNAIGPAIPILGNIDNLSFPSETAGTLRSQAETCLRAGAENAPFILCTSGGDIPIQTPPENIHALTDAVRSSLPAPPPEVLWVVCNVLGAEVRELRRQGAIQGELLELNSMLHMDPPRLEKTLCGVIETRHTPMVLVYGDCCPAMLQLTERPGVARVNATNCAQLLAGKAHYKELMHSEAFIFLPEWMPRWQEIIEKELGLTGEVARDLFRESRKELVYFDTGVLPVPHRELDACAAYIGLPMRIEKTGLSHLRDALLSAHNELSESL